MSKAPVRVLITGAAGQIAYNLIPLFVGGEVFGPDQPMILHLLDIEMAQKGLDAVVMELHDGGYPLLHGIVATTKLEEGFKDIDYAVLLGGFPRLQGMTRADLLHKNCNIFVEQGKALGEYAKATCKTVVVANPANTNCAIAYRNSGGKIPAKNFTALTRLDQNRAVGQVSKALSSKGVNPSLIRRMVIWGNHSQDQYPDLTHGLVKIDGKEVKVSEAVDDKSFYETFIPTVQQRGAAVIKARGKSSAMSAANATKDHLHSWVCGTPEGQWASMAVPTDGKFYGLPEGIIFSVPTICKDGEYTVVEGLELSEDGKARLQVNVEKLQEELKVAESSSA